VVFAKHDECFVQIEKFYYICCDDTGNSLFISAQHAYQISVHGIHMLLHAALKLIPNLYLNYTLLSLMLSNLICFKVKWKTNLIMNKILVYK
jgi:hypothetical protein